MQNHRRVSSTCGSVSSLSRSERPASTQSSYTNGSAWLTAQSYASRVSICNDGVENLAITRRKRTCGYQQPHSTRTPMSELSGNHLVFPHQARASLKAQRTTGLSQRRPYHPRTCGSRSSNSSRTSQRQQPGPDDQASHASSGLNAWSLPEPSGSEPVPTSNTTLVEPIEVIEPTADIVQIPVGDPLPCDYPKVADPIDERQNIPKWQIWIQRIIFLTLIVGGNTACALAAFESARHTWVLVVLVFIKSKDILSTIAGIIGASRSSIQQRHEKMEESPKWILSLICAYKETEAQIMKTVDSTRRQELDPHQQVLCIIMDGTLGLIQSRFTSIACTMRRPYITWQAKRGELAIYAGWMERTPVILIEKMHNAGKKDSLILGHSLFNFPRKDAPLYSQLLRNEILTTVLPKLTARSPFPGFDYVFCTDADSTLHDNAMRNLTRGLNRDKQAIAACGALFAELAGPEVEWTTWHLFQQFQYTFGQYVRRRAEGVWGRVTCLPGCITMIAVRPEFAGALNEYASPVKNRLLLPHQVQYLGTDRRLTWCMLIQDVNLRTIFVPDAMSETVAPQTLEHYLSQRRRWASNAYFNDFYYTFGPSQRVITRVFGLIDIIRLTLVFYRVINTAVFIRFLISNFYVIRIVPLLIVTKMPVLWFLINVLFKRPVLRRRLHKLLFGLCIDQIISPFLSVIVFLTVVFHMGSPVWGKTGVSTEAAPMVGPPLPSIFSHDWAPERLNTLVRDVVRSRREEQPSTVTRVSTHRSI